MANLREARQLRADLISKIGRGERVAPSKVTLSDFADEWLARQKPRLRPKSLELYESSLRLHVKPRLGQRRLQSISVDDVVCLIGSMQLGDRYLIDDDGRLVRTSGEPYAAWTIRATVSLLSRVFASAVRAGMVSQSGQPARA